MRKQKQLKTATGFSCFCKKQKQLKTWNNKVASSTNWNSEISEAPPHGDFSGSSTQWIKDVWHDPDDHTVRLQVLTLFPGIGPSVGRTGRGAPRQQVRRTWIWKKIVGTKGSIRISNWPGFILTPPHAHPPKDGLGEIALWSATNKQLSTSLVLPGSLLSMTEI